MLDKLALDKENLPSLPTSKESSRTPRVNKLPLENNRGKWIEYQA
jgi:hypothetical protein